MKLKVTKEKAIQVLIERLKELEALNFDPKVWKDRTVLDLKEIFPLGSDQWLQVSFIDFDTFITADKIKVLYEGKATASKLLSSYIDFINQFSDDKSERETIVDDDYRDKYDKLLKKWNELVPQYNEQLKKIEELQTENLSKVTENNNLNSEIERIENSTIQLTDLTLRKLVKAISSLPIGQFIIFLSVVVAIIGGSFALGKLYQENASNTIQYDLKKENEDLKSQNKEMGKSIYILKKGNSHKDSIH